MSKITRVHLVGLQRARQAAGEYNSEGSAWDVCDDLDELIAQASAAPEQEPFAYAFRFAGCVTSSGPESWRNEIDRERPAQFLFDDGRVLDFKPLYTHADPSEVELLREERDSFQRVGILATERADAPEQEPVDTVVFVLRNIAAMEADEIDGDSIDLRFEDGEGRDTGCDVSIVEYAGKAADALEAATQRADAAERKLGEAVPIIERVKVKELVSPNCPLGKRIDAFLSASAEPATANFTGCKATDTGETGFKFAEPARGGDGEVL